MNDLIIKSEDVLNLRAILMYAEAAAIQDELGDIKDVVNKIQSKYPDLKL